MWSYYFVLNSCKVKSKTKKIILKVRVIFLSFKTTTSHKPYAGI